MLEIIYNDFKNFSKNKDLNRIEIEFIESDRIHRYQVIAIVHNLSGNPVRVHMGHVEKNEFQPQPSERISAQTVAFFEETFHELWEQAKAETSTLDSRWSFIKEKLNVKLLQ